MQIPRILFSVPPCSPKQRLRQDIWIYIGSNIKVLEGCHLFSRNTEEVGYRYNLKSPILSCGDAAKPVLR